MWINWPVSDYNHSDVSFDGDGRVDHFVYGGFHDKEKIKGRTVPYVLGVTR